MKKAIPVVPPPAADNEGLPRASLILKPDARPACKIRLGRDEVAPLAGLAKILYDADIVLLRSARDESRKE
jgi:hypothetical protein